MAQGRDSGSLARPHLRGRLAACPRAWRMKDPGAQRPELPVFLLLPGLCGCLSLLPGLALGSQALLPPGPLGSSSLTHVLMSPVPLPVRRNQGIFFFKQDKIPSSYHCKSYFTCCNRTLSAVQIGSGSVDRPEGLMSSPITFLSTFVDSWVMQRCATAQKRMEMFPARGLVPRCHHAVTEVPPPGSGRVDGVGRNLISIN